MADDKKKNDVSVRQDDAPTSELEALTDSMILRESEVDANTCPFADDDDSEEDPAALRARLKRERERVEQLLFDKEQLQSRLTGAEKEIAARQELTAILQKDLKDAHKTLSARERDAQRNRREIEALEALLESPPDAAGLSSTGDDDTGGADADVPILSDTIVDEEIVASPASAALDDSGLSSVRLELQDLKLYIDGRRQEWDRLESSLSARESELSESRMQLEARTREAAEMRGRLENADSVREQLQSELKQVRQKLRDESRARRQLEIEVADFQNIEKSAKDRTIAEQAGQLAAARHEIAELTGRIVQSEKHADEMRHVIDGLREELQPARTRTDVLRKRLDDERLRTAELEEQIASAKRELETLRSENSDLRDAFEREVRQLRLELDAAQDTIVGHETINEQLASDLIDNKTFRQALEEQLSAVEKGHGERVKTLERRVRSLERDLAERDRKIANKDGAISALLAELSGRGGSGESLHEFEVAIGEMDEQIAASESGHAERERITRVLIGSIDGQELRFPLFKNRLTVGRTAQNDIHLGAQFISRRHAVILTDEQGTRIVDWGSKNGVFVNGFRISEQPLRNGDKVRIGTAEFLYEERQKR